MPLLSATFRAVYIIITSIIPIIIFFIPNISFFEHLLYARQGVCHMVSICFNTYKSKKKKKTTYKSSFMIVIMIVIQ